MLFLTLKNGKNEYWAKCNVDICNKSIGKRKLADGYDCMSISMLRSMIPQMVRKLSLLSCSYRWFIYSMCNQLCWLTQLGYNKGRICKLYKTAIVKCNQPKILLQIINDIQSYEFNDIYNIDEWYYMMHMAVGVVYKHVSCSECMFEAMDCLGKPCIFYRM